MLLVGSRSFDNMWDELIVLWNIKLLQNQWKEIFVVSQNPDNLRDFISQFVDVSKITFIKDGNEIFSTSEPVFEITGLDLYGAYIQLEALDDGATISKITISQSISNNQSNNYNTNVHITEEEIAVCGNIEVIIQDDTGSEESNIVCY